MTHSTICVVLQVEAQSGQFHLANRPSTDWWLAAFTGALVLATLALVVVGIFQYRAMSRQETWMKRTVLVAEQTAHAAKQ
ncbi:MAG TPA: hypothetical protein VMB02_05995, partial [Candidatus Aquilonibacter sp.]|nr:hypothetical protein [Candidatus Aquilonibacter sp.]